MFRFYSLSIKYCACTSVEGIDFSYYLLKLQSIKLVQLSGAEIVTKIDSYYNYF